jgi:glycosyltransferase involved in cell wall biosynthesis
VVGLNPKKFCVLLPAYNEAKNIARIVGEIRDLGFDTLVVDDGSTDETAEEAKRTGTNLIISRRNEGKGAAVRKGFDWFLMREYEALILMDADGQHDPRELARFVEALEKGGADLVIGNRMNDPGKMPWIRRLTNRFMSFILSGIARQRIPDTQCGYRAVTRLALRDLALKTSRFEIESEMLLKAAKMGFKIDSVPIRSVYEGGKSQVHPARDTVRFFKFLFGYLFSK